MKVKFLMTCILAFISLDTFPNCKYFDRAQLSGVFTEFEYFCTESSSDLNLCHTSADPNLKVSTIEIMPVPLGTEEGLQIQLIDDSRISIPNQVVFDYTFSTHYNDEFTTLECQEYQDETGPVSSLVSKTVNGPFEGIIQLTRRGHRMEFEVTSSFHDVKSNYKFVVKI